MTKLAWGADVLYSLTVNNGERGESASQVCIFVPLNK